MTHKKGLIIDQSYWYRGWCLMLQKIDDFVRRNPLVTVLNTPSAIELTFHKLRCQRLFGTHKLSTPEIIMDRVPSYEALVRILQRREINQVFIKPYHGSSASGVMAFRIASGKQVLYTTAKLEDGALYNSLRLQEYRCIKEVETVIETMSPNGLFVEEWIRKKEIRSKSVDFRILVVNGHPAFVVPRMSNHVITNLHLGNEKGDIGEVEKIWGSEIIEHAKRLAVMAVETVGGLFYGGVDIAISTSGHPYILEVNTFGDMLLGVYKDRLTTYEYEVKTLRGYL